MFKKSLLYGGVFALVLVSAASCSSGSTTCQGGEACACYANDTCNAGLACRSHTCVNLDGTGGSSSGGASGGGIDVKACLACAEKNCTSEASACKAATGCDAIINCLVSCNSDANCLAQCNKSASADASSKSLSYEACAFTQCIDDCVYAGPMGSGGSGNTGNGGSDSGGANSGGASAAGGIGAAGSGGGGSPSVELVSGVNWLGLTADAAPPTRDPNGKLGIDGVLYAYGDGCSTMTWDAVTRCVVGELCLASSVNWGVAIGFDFYNTGATGVPPDTKHPWSATAVSATGLAWQTHSLLSTSMQVWVQNMDPSFGGSCSAATCSINGPPDGISSAPQNGQFLFSNMQKDDWGGTGLAYVFDPANILALQFKIPAALDSSSTSYELCVDKIGVIR